MSQIYADLDSIEAVASFILEKSVGKVIFLHGKIGSGKTTLASKIVKLCGVERSVTSPTFSLLNIYDGRVFHYDMYNKSFEELFSLGVLENFEEEGVHIVEWGDDKLKNYLSIHGIDSVDVYIEEGEKGRVYRMEDA